jgi:processive 1,2-diacylglycerol beta-glucosyltransferase
MAVSDVLISKSGGITVSEALAKELPIIVIFPIPGQETWNCDYLVERGAAVKVERLADLRRALEEMIADPARLERMRSSIREIKRPDASRDIANLALQI